MKIIEYTAIGKATPDFKTLDMNYKELKLFYYIGEKLCTIRFWTSLCVPCISGLLPLNAIHNKYNSKVYVYFLKYLKLNNLQ